MVGRAYWGELRLDPSPVGRPVATGTSITTGRDVWPVREARFLARLVALPLKCPDIAVVLIPATQVEHAPISPLDVELGNAV
jgi:hypothetical protein